MNTILNLHYLEEQTQTEIGKTLGMSTVKVNRLIHQAREQGYVNISIRTPFQHLFDLESRLKAVFGLQYAIVIPAVGESNKSLLNPIGTAAASFLLEHLQDGDVLGINSGATVNTILQAIEPKRTYQVEVVPTLGAAQGRMTTDTNYVAVRLAERLGGKAYQLNAPAFMDTREHCETLLSLGPVKMILDIARRANIALVGVGTVDVEVSRFAQFTALSAEDMAHVTECGGVGEINTFVYDIEGKECAQEYTDRIVGLTLAEIMKIPLRIGMTATAVKALPLYGALRGGYLNAVITDEAAARGVIELYEQKFQKTP